MRHDLKNEEFNLVCSILKKGLNKAANAFTSLAKMKVILEPVEINFISDPLLIRNLIPENTPVNIVTTDMIGQIKGTSYLIISEYEAAKIFSSCTTGSGFEDKEEFVTEVLKEIDNILCASVIAELSNHLNLSAYGDVPFLKKISADEIPFYNFGMDSENEIFFVSINNFHFPSDLDLKPVFIWKFTKSILNKMEEKEMKVLSKS
jgi:chemotaxis protein CheY-P-specific phosphatase CheC